MTLFQQSLRTAVALVAFGIAAASSLAGDKVIFSRGSGEIASPQKPAAINVPAGADELRGLSGGRPEMPMPYVPPPAARTGQKKAERRTVFDEPELFSDPLKEKDDSEESHGMTSPWLGNSKEKNEKRSSALSLTDRFGKPTEDRALSPVRQFDWKPDASDDDGSKESDRSKREKSQERNNGGRFFNSQWKDVAGTSPLRAVQDRSETLESGTVLNLGDKVARREREQKRDREERRVEFEKLINPGFAPLGSRDPASLAGIASPLDSTKGPPAPALTPVPAQVAPGRSMMSPFLGGGDQHRPFNGASFDDLNNKAFGGSVVKPVAPSVSPETAARRPLMNQPTFQDFPGRRF